MKDENLEEEEVRRIERSYEGTMKHQTLCELFRDKETFLNQPVQVKGWDQAMYRLYTTNLLQEFRSDQLPETPDWQQQILLLRLGSRVVTIGYDGEADMYPRLNTLYGRRYTSSTSAAAT